ncbi:MAG TPA: RNA polymerase sigma factor [Thermoanaerobaculia bacterium]|nr:RNA polymerase sigma factor [Thermoanaerobaculia bacterium]
MPSLEREEQLVESEKDANAQAPVIGSTHQAVSDEQAVTRVLAGERELFELLMRRYNERLYRVARAIVDDDSEAEDVVQDAFVRAYNHLGQFAGRAQFSNWLTRIAVNEARARARRRRRVLEIDSLPNAQRDLILKQSSERDPEQRAVDQDLRTVLEAAIGSLSAPYRVVLVLRDVEGLSTAATAECLGVKVSAVKTRLHRARAMLRRRLVEQARAACRGTFDFPASRCDRVVAAALARIPPAH